MKKKYHFMVFFVLCTSTIFGQIHDFGNVTMASLQEKQHPKDSSANAAILFKRGYTYMSFKAGNGYFLNHVVKLKIKIYKKEGLSNANLKIPFYVGFKSLNNETFKLKNAFTYNIVDNQISKIALKSEGVFESQVNQNWHEVRITMPNVKVGSIFELEYIVTTEYLNRFPNFDFQYNIPVDYVEYKSEIPEFYIYKTLQIGYLKLKGNIEVVPFDKVFSSKYCYRLSYQPKYVVSDFSLENVPALLEQSFVDHIENYRGSIQNELELLRMPDSPVKDYTNTWEGLAKIIYDYSDFGKQLKQKSFFESDLESITNINILKEQKLDTIFKFVQNRMNWDKTERMFCQKGVKKAYQSKTGNSAEINFILIAMLSEAGFEASPVLVSTTSNGTAIYPSITGFNYVIAAVKMGNKTILLDATRKYTLPNLLPLEILNGNGRLIKKDGSSEEISLMPTTHSRETTSIIAEIIDSKVEGKAQLVFTDQKAIAIYENTKVFKNDALVEYFEKQFPTIKIDNILKSNSNQNNIKYTDIRFDFEHSNLVEYIGDQILVNPLLFSGSFTNELKQDSRFLPIYFGYPTQKKHSINLKIPKNYEVISMPKPFSYALEQGLARYDFNVAQADGIIQISSFQQINSSIFSAESYNTLKDFFNKIIDVCSQKIILRKKI